MALEFLGNFTKRTLESLRRFREPELVIAAPVAADPDLDAWECAKAKMALEELGRWEKMNLAEAARVESVCGYCGGREINGRCARDCERG